MLFQDEWGINEEPLEDVDITTTILYFSKIELKEFKELAKAGIKIEFGQDYQQKGNLSDFLLKILREKYSNTKKEIKNETLITSTEKDPPINIWDQPF